MKKLSQKGKKILEIAILSLVVLLAYFFWNTVYVFPFKLFTVLLHESAHGLITLATGGTIKEIIINFQFGGNCLSSGGNAFLIGNAGYLGSLIMGGLLILSTLDNKYCRTACNSMVIIMLLLLIFVRNTFGILFVVSFMVLFIIIPRVLSKEITSFLLLIFGTLSCLYSIIDIKEDLIQLEYRQTDAQILAGLTGVPAILWGIVWLTLSVAVFLFLMKIKFKTRLND